MSTLVIAPASNLNNRIDWVSAAAGRQLTVLNGTVTVREVLAAIASGRYRIIHFATHGCATALAMSDGEIPTDLLENALRGAAGKVELVILAACSSYRIGAHIYKAGVPRTLSWPTDVNDEIAGEWARVFYASLGISGDIGEAQVSAGERIRQLGAEEPIFLNGRLSLLEQQVAELRKSAEVFGVPAWLAIVLIGYGVLLLGLFVLLARLH